MTNEMLQAAADRAGVKLVDAEALIRELRVPMAGMKHAGTNAAIPPFTWPSTLNAEEWRAMFPGWEGLTHGEYNAKKSEVIWQMMCDSLLAERQVYGWELEK